MARAMKELLKSYRPRSLRPLFRARSQADPKSR
jgi:hypothetical protein